MTDKQAQQAALEARLLVGFTRIGEALNRGADVTNWPRHWLDLLVQFEAIGEELALDAEEVA
jgi:hypothetical protein